MKDFLSISVKKKNLPVLSRHSLMQICTLWQAKVEIG